ncbi:hypothetical protein JCM5353_004743 [Sporobolomyces roseus]
MVHSVSPQSILPTIQPRAATESLSSTLVESSSSSHSNSSLSNSDPSDSSSSELESDSDEEDTDSSEEEDDHSELLKQLLIKAKQSAKQRQIDIVEAKKNKSREDGLAGNEEMVFFGNEDEEEEESSDEEDQEGASPHRGTPKASTSKSISTLPPSLVRPLSLPTSYSTSSTSLAKGKARAGPISLAQDLSGVLSNEGVTVVGNKGRIVEDEKNGQGEKWGVAPVARMSQKAYKARQPHTAGSKWFDMPATPMTPELKREIDAMRLRNALDPKKFMKGGAKKEKIGEFFQIGHVITPNSRATNNTSLPTASKRSFVEELVEDEQARAYAKRKTKEVMQKGMSGRKRQRKGGKGSYAMGQGGGKDGTGEAGGKRRKG